MKRIYKDDQDNMIFGVCGGIADALNIDPTIIRIIFATLMFTKMNYMIILFYLVYAIVAPSKSSVKLEEMQKEAIKKQKEKGDK